MSFDLARLRYADVAYGFMLAGALLPLCALPTWQFQLAASIGVVLVVTVLTGRAAGASISGLLVAITLFLLRADPSGLPLSYRLLGLATAVICAAPMLVWRRREGTFPILGAFCILQGVYIYVGALIAQPTPAYQAIYTLPIRELGITTTLLYVTVLVAAGLATRRLRPVLPVVRRWTSRVPAGSEPASAMFTRLVIVFLAGIGAARVLPASVASHLGAIPQLVASGRIVAVALAAVLWLRGSLTPLQRAAVVVGVLLDVATGINGAFALYSSASAAIAVFVVLLVRRPRLAVAVLLAVVPILLVLNAAKTEARADPTRPGGRLADIGLFLSDSVKAAIAPQPGQLSASAERFDYPSELLGYIAYHVPRDDPYWNKESYTLLPLLLVPRAIAPFKPAISLGNDFGRTYGLLAPNDFVTSANTPLQVEAWANFGIEGLVIIAALLGGLLGLADGLFDASTLDGAALGTLLAVQLASGIESGISAWALAVPMVVILLPVVHWAIGSRPEPVPSGRRAVPLTAPDRVDRLLGSSRPTQMR